MGILKLGKVSSHTDRKIKVQLIVTSVDEEQKDKL
jgi:hypothetical protein